MIVPVLRARRVNRFERHAVIAARVSAYPEGGLQRGGRRANMLKAWVVEGDEWRRSHASLLPALAAQLSVEPELAHSASRRFAHPPLRIPLEEPIAKVAKEMPSAAWVMLDGISRGVPTFWSEATFPGDTPQDGERRFLSTLALVVSMLPGRARMLVSVASGVAVETRRFLVSYSRVRGPFPDERRAVGLPSGLPAGTPLADIATRAGYWPLRESVAFDRTTLGHIGGVDNWVTRGLAEAKAASGAKPGEQPLPSAVRSLPLSAAEMRVLGRQRTVERQRPVAVETRSGGLKSGLQSVADWARSIPLDLRAEPGDGSDTERDLRHLLRFSLDLLGGSEGEARRPPDDRRSAATPAPVPADIEAMVRGLTNLLRRGSGRPLLYGLVEADPKRNLESELERTALRRLFVLAAFVSDDVREALDADGAPVHLTDVPALLGLLAHAPADETPESRHLRNRIESWLVRHIQQLGVLDPSELDCVLQHDCFTVLDHWLDPLGPGVGSRDMLADVIQSTMVVALEADEDEEASQSQRSFADPPDARAFAWRWLAAPRGCAPLGYCEWPPASENLV